VEEADPFSGGRAEVALGLLAWATREREIFSAVPDAKVADLVAPHFAFLRSRKIEGLAAWRTGSAPAERSLYDKVWSLQQAQLVQVLTSLRQKNVNALVFKGAEHFARLNRRHAFGFLGDLDILVGEDELAATKLILRDCGYEQAFFDVQLGRLANFTETEIARVESNHYELMPFDIVAPIPATDAEVQAAAAWNSHPLRIVDDQLLVVTTLDVHHRVALEIASKQLVDRAIPSSLGVARTLSISDHFWLTAARYYVEVNEHGKRSLRDLLYLANLAKHPSIDWSMVCQVAALLDIRPSLYYFCVMIGQLIGTVPETAIHSLDPRLGSRRRDWGCPSYLLLDEVHQCQLPSWPRF
jgi:hypothetical protein